MKKTKKAHEKYLNDLYADMYSESQAIDNFRYLTNKARGACTTLNNIRNAHSNHMLGSLLRRLDPIAFNCSYQDQ